MPTGNFCHMTAVSLLRLPRPSCWSKLGHRIQGSYPVAIRRSSSAVSDSSGPQVRELSQGWHAIFSTQHGREYYWHRPSGATTWNEPTLETNTPASTAATPVDSETSLSAEKLSSPSAEKPASPEAEHAAKRPQQTTLRAREFPDGWCGVFSPEHGREYYWHRPSGKTSWDAPRLQNASAAAATENSEDLCISAYRSPDAVRRAVAGILRGNPLGEELQPTDFQLVHSLLKHHPDSAAKVGPGVRAIKVDTSLHDSGSRCFWILRVDGSAEDFSARKSIEGLRSAWPMSE